MHNPGKLNDFLKRVGEIVELPIKKKKRSVYKLLETRNRSP